MATQAAATSGADNGGNAGQVAAAAAGNTAAAATQSDVVSRADHDRALADMHKFKKEAAEAKAAIEKSNADKMKQENQWKELAELNEKKANEATAESVKLKSSYLNEKKFSAIQLAAKALGLRDEAVSDLESLDTSPIQIEYTSTGKINVLGVNQFVEGLKTKKPHWFEGKKPVVNSAGQTVVDSGGDVTVAMITKAEAEGKKSGDLTQYYDLMKKYQQQRRAKK